MSNQSLRVMWFVPPAIAIAASWIDEPNFSLEASRTQSSDEQFDALVSGRVDAVVTSMDNILHWNQRPGPKDFVIVAQIESTTPLLVISSEQLTGLQDLNGANILVDAPENGFVIALRAMLDNAGLTLENYRLTPVGGVKERFDAIVGGQGDATLLGPPFDGVALDKGLHKVASVQAVYPNFPGQGVIVRKPTAETNPALSTWIKLLNTALKTLPNDLERLCTTIIERGLPHQVIDPMLETLPTSLTPAIDGIKLLIQHRAQLGLIGSDVTYEQIVDLSLI